jgi:hypothetical protein
MAGFNNTGAARFPGVEKHFAVRGRKSMVSHKDFDRANRPRKNVRSALPASAYTSPKLDADIYLPALLQGFFGSRKWMAARLGAVGGKSRSAAKAAASQRNGKSGGRPRKFRELQRRSETTAKTQRKTKRTKQANPWRDPQRQPAILTIRLGGGDDFQRWRG